MIDYCTVLYSGKVLLCVCEKLTQLKKKCAYWETDKTEQLTVLAWRIFGVFSRQYKCSNLRTKIDTN